MNEDVLKQLVYALRAEVRLPGKIMQKFEEDRTAEHAKNIAKKYVT